MDCSFAIPHALTNSSRWLTANWSFRSQRLVPFSKVPFTAPIGFRPATNYLFFLGFLEQNVCIFIFIYIYISLSLSPSLFITAAVMTRKQAARKTGVDQRLIRNFMLKYALYRECNKWTLLSKQHGTFRWFQRLKLEFNQQDSVRLSEWMTSGPRSGCRSSTLTCK